MFNNETLKNMSIEELKNLNELINSELKSRKPPEEKLIVYTHDCKNSANHHKTKYKHWVKVIKSVDITKTNGYAFIGDFLNINFEHKLPIGSILVEVCNTDITAYQITASGKAKIDTAKTNSMSGFIEKIAILL